MRRSGLGSGGTPYRRLDFGRWRVRLAGPVTGWRRIVVGLNFFAAHEADIRVVDGAFGK